MKNIIETLIGIIMVVVGAFMFMDNVEVSGLYSGFYAIGQHGMFHIGTSTIGVIVICMAIALFAAIVLPNLLTKGILIGLFVLFVVAIILSLKFYFKTISGASLFMIIGLMVIGTGLIVKGVIFISKS